MTILKNKWLWFYLCFVLVVAGCDVSPPNRVPNPVQTKSTSLTGEHIRTVTLDSSEKGVINVFGKPSSVDFTEKPKIKNLTYVQNRKSGKLIFSFVDSKMVRYMFSDQRFKTAKGISIGSTSAEVKKAYGKNYVERTDTSGRVIMYVDKIHKNSIEFIVDKGKVRSILFQKGTKLEFQKPVGAAL
ncbi:hypothetical protein [Heyndrickxia acidicola]|uniref:Beta-barrel assembly machine subunit BamE n=1 Tax=Heyndrickxia acidicola TaxID=209389 RepID=A0ABU6MM56_9BACI|nr:hypothetical protein [Heyndrickxia acidicola]MED1205765.1 hypothetical protein [Heyndrickxia acidicola]